MKFTYSKPQIEGDSVVTRVSMTIQPREVRAHPDRFKADIGDTYQGMRVVRDPTIPMNEIHVIEGNRRMVMRYAEK